MIALVPYLVTPRSPLSHCAVLLDPRIIDRHIKKGISVELSNTIFFVCTFYREIPQQQKTFPTKPLDYIRNKLHNTKT